MQAKKMRIEIWGDVTCHHCYISKINFEKALSQFKDSDKIEAVWKSFELASDLKTDERIKLPEFLVNLHGITIEQAKGMTDHLTNTVKEVGLEFNLNDAIPANSFNAHRILHLAKDHKLQEKAGERLFKAYYTDAKNVDDIPTLIQLASEIGLDTTEVKSMLESAEYVDEVRQDINGAKRAGITRLPHYVFNATTKISGAQESSVYLETLEKTFTQWQLENDQVTSEIGAGQSCNTEGDCQ